MSSHLGVWTPSRVVAILTNELDLDAKRVAWRGVDAEVDSVLNAWRIADVAYRNELDRSATCDTASSDRKQPQVAASLDSAMRNLLGTAKAAAVLDITTAAVTLAAREWRLDGEQIEGRWNFTAEAVAGFDTMRRR